MSTLQVVAQELSLDFVLTATIDGYSVGAINAGLNAEGFGVLWIYEIIVDADKRRRGVGRELVARLEAEAKLRGQREMRLRCMIENNIGKHFWEKMGFTVDENDDDMVFWLMRKAVPA
jgi:ribosomal protein S18 acetylase RimI-like enzyme